MLLFSLCFYAGSLIGKVDIPSTSIGPIYPIEMTDGFLVELSFKKFAISRNSTRMFQLTNGNWEECQSSLLDGVKSFAYYRLERKIYAVIVTSKGGQSYQVYDVSMDCKSTSLDLKYNQQLFTTPQSILYIKSAIVNRQLISEIGLTGNEKVIISSPNLILSAALKVGKKVIDSYASTVSHTGAILFAMKNGGVKQYNTTQILNGDYNTMATAEDIGLLFNCNFDYPWSSNIGLFNAKHFPSFDFYASVDPELLVYEFYSDYDQKPHTIQFTVTDEAMYGYEVLSMDLQSTTSISSSTMSLEPISSVQRLANVIYYSSTFVEYNMTQIRLSSTTKYSTVAINTALYPFYNESKLFLTNGVDLYQIVGNGFSPNKYEFKHTFVVLNSSIVPYCSTDNTLSIFKDSRQSNLTETPYFKLLLNTMDPLRVKGIKYANYNEHVLFNHELSYIDTQLGFEVAINEFIKFNRSVVNNVLTTQVFKELDVNGDIVTLGNGTLTVSNECKVFTTDGILNGNSIKFNVDNNLYKDSKFVYTFDTNSSSCSDTVSVNSTNQIGSFADPYLQDMSFNNFTYGTNTTTGNDTLIVNIPSPLSLTLLDYHKRNFYILASFTGKRCLDDLNGTVVVDVPNLKFIIPIDAESRDIKTVYTITLYISNANLTCTQSTTFNFIAGTTEHTINNWYGGYEYDVDDKFILKLNDYFIRFVGFKFDVLNVSLSLEGCQVPETLNSILFDVSDKNRFSFNLPNRFLRSQFHFKPVLSGKSDYCYFKTSSIPFIKTNAANFIDTAFNNFTIANTSVSLIDNKFKIDMSRVTSVKNQIQSYLSRNFTIQMILQGQTFPVRNLIRNTTLETDINYVNNIIELDADVGLYFPCKRSYLLTLHIFSDFCKISPSTALTFGDSIYAMDKSLFINTTNPTIISYNNDVTQIRLNRQFLESSIDSSLSINTRLNVSSCGLTASRANTLRASSPNLSYTFAKSLVNKYSLFTFGASGMVDQCQFQVSNFTFNEGTYTSSIAAINQLVLNQNEIGFSGTQLVIADSGYQLAFNQLNSTYSKSSTLTVENCLLNFPGDSNFGYTIPLDYLGNDANYTLYTAILSSDCYLESVTPFRIGNSPSLSAAYYYFGVFQIIGRNMGDTSSSCQRPKSIHYKYTNGSVSIHNATIISWTNTLIVVEALKNVKSLLYSFGDYKVTIEVAQTYYSMTTFMNNFVINNNQFFSFSLNSFGFKSTDTWTISNTNTLYSLFTRTSGSIVTPIGFNLPTNTVAKFRIYFTVGVEQVPCFLDLEILNTPTLSPQIYYTSLEGNSAFSIKYSDLFQFNFDIPRSMDNLFVLKPEHQVYYIPSNIIDQVDTSANLFLLDFQLTVLKAVAIGQTFYNSSASNIYLGSMDLNNVVQQVNYNITWDLNENTNILRLGTFPLILKFELREIYNLKPSAIYEIVADVKCQLGEYPNIYGIKSSNGLVTLCSPCPVGAKCSSTGTEAPKRIDGYYREERDGIYAFTECYPIDACIGEDRTCSEGYGISYLYRW